MRIYKIKQISKLIKRFRLLLYNLFLKRFKKTSLVRSILEISYNPKSSPKKLFAETSKKNNYFNSNYPIGNYINQKENYIACLTDENEPRVNTYDSKIDKNMTKLLVKNIKYLPNFNSSSSNYFSNFTFF